MTKAHAYLRVSGLDQVDGFGFDRQLAAIQAFAASRDIEILQVYREEGVTGKSELDGRPALQRLISDLLGNGVRLVLIERLDRLARSLIVQETIIQDLTRRGIEIISVAEPDVCKAGDDPTRILVRQILGAVFEFERKMIAGKLRSARECKKARSGSCEGNKPYGYMSGGRRQADIPNPAEFPTLKIMRDLKASGHNGEEIAEKLNALNLRGRSGKPWRSSVIRRILANPQYEINLRYSGGLERKAVEDALQ
jgi:DNA invertase Pin-like site-specific DNA recombinase